MIKLGMRILAIFATRGGAVLGGVLLTLVIGRNTGPSGLGSFSVFLSVLGLVAIIGRRGLDTIPIRTVAHIPRGSPDGGRQALLQRAARITLGTTLLLSPIAALILMSGALGTSVPFAGGFILVCLPPFTLLAVFSGYLKGTDRPWISPVFEQGGISLLAAVMLLGLWTAGLRVDLIIVMFAFTAALAIIGLGGAAFAARDNRAAAAQHRDTQQETDLRRGQLAFTVIALSGFAAQAGSFAIVAPFLSEHQLGIARAAERLALLVSFPVLAINPFISASVARLIRAGRRDELWRQVGGATLLSGAIGFPVLMMMLFVPELPLGLLGPEFLDAAPYLRILALANFILALLGPFTVVMNMGGGEQQLMWVSIASLIAAIFLFTLLSLLFDIYGFIASYALMLVFRQAAIFILAVSRHRRGQ